MPGNNEKTPNARLFGDSREEGKRNTYQGEPLNTRLPRNHEHFDTEINVAGLTVSTGVVTGGTFPDETCVALLTLDEHIALSPAEACALAAALQAVAVHVMEQEPREIRRHTEPGAPSFEEAL